MSDKPILLRINYIYTYCTDIKAIRKFYSECIGLPEAIFSTEYGCVSYRLPGLEFMFWQTEDALSRPEGFADQPGGGGGELPATSWTVLVDEREFAAVVSRLQKAGYESNAAQPVWLQNSYWAFAVKDPAGNTVELTTVPSRKPDSPIWE